MVGASAVLDGYGFDGSRDLVEQIEVSAFTATSERDAY